ncbi:hypothetical protein BDV59DRAFT_178590 [Aspergillus ambiguus]|uniref:uncharacterized protein n=1 Tax=Aspergillus ambiguus TaxID=176160 RepID=UPI003CCCE160
MAMSRDLITQLSKSSSSMLKPFLAMSISNISACLFSTAHITVSLSGCMSRWLSSNQTTSVCPLAAAMQRGVEGWSLYF